MGIIMRYLLSVLLVIVILPVMARAQQSAGAEPADPYIWLEEFSSPRAMEWVTSHNAKTTQRLEADSRYARNYAEALAIAGARDRIPQPRFLHGEIYNFW